MCSAGALAMIMQLLSGSGNSKNELDLQFNSKVVFLYFNDNQNTCGYYKQKFKPYQEYTIFHVNHYKSF